MSEKSFKKGDLVEYDFGVGVVLEGGVHHSHHGNYDVYRVLWNDGTTDWKSVKHLHDGHHFLKHLAYFRKWKKIKDN